jgi:hypothetical protein
MRHGNMRKEMPSTENEEEGDRMDETHQKSWLEKCASDNQLDPNTDKPYDYYCIHEITLNMRG